jgi:pyruvate/2-oxoglutarate dehydrogenase complex dihydrolipoamide acyltransferase (E2) component
MPTLSHYVTDGKVTRWYKKEGDSVQEGEPLLEIETIKSTTDVPAPGTGILVHILVQEGEVVLCETLLAEIEVQTGQAQQ